MATSELDRLIRRVTALFRKHASHFGLDPETVEARYILNWGGFGNANFTIRDGQRSLHLKLAAGAEDQEPLRRWQSIHKMLTSRYRAPQVLGWVRIPGTEYAGLLFEHIPGRQADFARQPDVLAGVLDLLPRLHQDSALIDHLIAQDGPPGTCAEAFLDLYIDRLDGDLLGVAANLPPFVPLDLLDWMMGETRELEGLARDLPAFQPPAGAPTHSDLYPNNILVTRAGGWQIIDWDDLALGDPALEYSILLGGQWRAALAAAGPADLRAVAAAEAARLWAMTPALADEAMRERFFVCLRALLLDEIIDSLADWVEVAFAPQHLAEVRPVKERIHREALALYRLLYPPGGSSHPQGN
jgi:hypothetical protein